MGIISRHAGAPFVDGETLAGADLEGDFDTIYTEFNGNIEGVNFADGAVTTAKIADGNVTAAKIGTGAVTTVKLDAGAVTQAKMTSGAATMSESEYTAGDVAVTPTATYVTLETISHVVGNPARHVMFLFSAQNNTGANRTFTFGIFRDTVVIADSEVSRTILSGATQDAIFFVDTGPTPGATHTYELKAKCGGGSTGTINKIQFFALEPRS